MKTTFAAAEAGAVTFKVDVPTTKIIISHIAVKFAYEIIETTGLFAPINQQYREHLMAIIANSKLTCIVMQSLGIWLFLAVGLGCLCGIQQHNELV